MIPSQNLNRISYNLFPITQEPRSNIPCNNNIYTKFIPLLEIIVQANVTDS